MFLRDATRDLHHDLDATISRLDLTTPAGYRAFLVVHARALLPLEQALERAGVDAVFPEWPRHRRSAALELDLVAAELPSGETEEVAPISGPASIFGVLYVLEGSRLGGKLLARAAEGQPVDQRHFLLHGADARLWQGFLERLDLLGDGEEMRSGLLSGARLAFETYARAARHVLLEFDAQRNGSQSVAG